MKKLGFPLVAALVGCVGLAPASFAKVQHHKTSTRIEFVGLINDGQPIQVDLVPNRTTREQPKTAAEYMYPNMYPEKTPAAPNPGVARRKAHYR